MSRRTGCQRAWVARVLVCASWIVLSCTASAQVPGDFPVIGISSAGDCANPPQICDVTGFSASTGVLDFWFFPLVSAPGIGARFGVTWPNEWTLMEVQVCHGRYVQGGITVPGSGMTLEFAADQASQAILRLRFLASTPGTLYLTEDPATGEFAYQQPNGAWSPYYSVPSLYKVVVGERSDSCGHGPWPIMRPCSWCDLVTSTPCSPGTVDLPWKLELVPGTVLVDTLTAWSRDRQSCVPPECGQPPSGPCIDGVWSDAPWLTFEALDYRSGPIRIVMTADARTLAPGTYSPGIRYGGGCHEVCGSMTVLVGPVAVQGATWGRIKALGAR